MATRGPRAWWLAPSLLRWQTLQGMAPPRGHRLAHAGRGDARFTSFGGVASFFGLAFAILLLAAPSVARAELREAVNRARLQGCRASVRAAPLRDNSRLGAAATALAGGQSLHAALTAAGYYAAQSSVVHLSGSSSDADVGRLLAANDCSTLTDPLLTDLGVYRRGLEVWLVFAAPAPLPTGNPALVSQKIVSLVNAARASARQCGGKLYAAAAALTLNRALSDAALAHSRDMAAFAEFDHRGHDGSSPAARVERAGYGAWVVGENIAAGAMTPEQVTQGWLDSPAHCENIMDPRFKDIGIGFAVNLSSAELVYWTQDFAVARRPR